MFTSFCARKSRDRYNTSAVDSSMPLHHSKPLIYIKHLKKWTQLTVVIKFHNFLTKHHWSDVDIFYALLFIFLYTTSFPIFTVSITRSQWHHIHYKYFQEVRPWELYAYTSSGELSFTGMPFTSRILSPTLRTSRPGLKLVSSLKYNDITESGVLISSSFNTCIKC